MSCVPKGSVSGPILFLIHVIDLDDDITSEVLTCSVDTKVLRRFKNDETSIYTIILIS